MAKVQYGDYGAAAAGAQQPPPPPLRSVHTANFPEILTQLRCSLLVTTYQAGKVVMVREDGGQINTHFRTFTKPMGMAMHDNHLAIGTAQQIWEFRNVPAVAGKLEPPGKHDVCFMPRRMHVTGNIQIHEMAYANDDELWFINTAFSCLCTYEKDHSFYPRWRPKFVTALAPGDRCHLNGLGTRDGKLKYVTALGRTDTPGGWREDKKHGGLIIDLDSEEIVTQGLSFPHSPRWYADRLWVLESGNGSFGLIDLPTGRYEPIIQLPGFTRGLDFIGNLAFIGMSQVRETAVFGGITITERLSAEDRNCGVWVVDIRSGQLVAFLRFEEAVQEIFAVSVLPGVRYPEMITDRFDLINASFVLPDEALAEVPAALKDPQPSTPAADGTAGSRDVAPTGAG